jgi:hypothetical protein
VLACALCLCVYVCGCVWLYVWECVRCMCALCTVCVFVCGVHCALCVFMCGVRCMCALCTVRVRVWCVVRGAWCVFVCGVRCTCCTWQGSFPWDDLLLECGFLSLFLPSLPGLHLQWAAAAVPPALVAFSFRWLLFRVMMGFGKFKVTGLWS